MIVTGELRFAFFESLEKTVDELTAVALECRYNVLDRALEECHNVGDEFLLALDCAESFEVFGTYVEAFFSISSLESGNGGLLIGYFLEELCGNICNVAEHYSSVALEAAIEGSEVYLRVFESLDKEIVLYNNHLNFLLKALATELTGLLRVETGNVYEVEVSVFVELFAKLSDY